MTIRFDLPGLTHERLVDAVREGGGAEPFGPRTDLSPSLYRRNPDVPALHIQTYPKRRARSLDHALRGVAPSEIENPTYQDFLLDTATPVTEDLERA